MELVLPGTEQDTGLIPPLVPNQFLSLRKGITLPKAPGPQHPPAKEGKVLAAVSDQCCCWVRIPVGSFPRAWKEHSSMSPAGTSPTLGITDHPRWGQLPQAR